MTCSLWLMDMVSSFFILGAPPAAVETGVYQIPLVILSYLVASFASYTALVLAQHVVAAGSTREHRLFHCGGALAMGAGIWSMHFVGMLSFKMRMQLDYDPLITLLSLVIAIGVAYWALEVVARDGLSAPQIIVGAVLMGIGICSMHYTGMAAMEFDGRLRYWPGIFALSVAIAIAASGAALWMAFTLARHPSPYRFLFQLCAAVIMGAAICGMHYTGMAAAVFIPDANCRYDPNQNFDTLARAVAATTALILAIALGFGMYRRAQMEFRVQSSEARLRTVIDNALDAVVAMDRDGRITEWNLQAEVIFGWSRLEAIGQILAETIIPPAAREAHKRGLQRFLASGIGPILNQRIEVSALNRGGELFPAEVAVTGQATPDGHHFTAFIRDVTQRRQNEESRALLAAIVESSRDAIVSTTLEGVILSWNAGAESLFGYSAAEAIGQGETLIIPPGRREEEQATRGRLRAGSIVEEYETQRVAKDGRVIDVSLTMSPIRAVGGDMIGASKIARDITERKRVELTIERQQETIRRLSTPVLPLSSDMLLVPIIGVLDPQRTSQLADELLHSVRTHRAKTVVLDITGVAGVDADVATQLIGTAKAVRLMGGRVILTGVTAEVAEALVNLGIDLGELDTVGHLQAGLEFAGRVM